MCTATTGALESLPAAALCPKRTPEPRPAPRLPHARAGKRTSRSQPRAEGGMGGGQQSGYCQKTPFASLNNNKKLSGISGRCA
jgi:hypothetical protein